MTTEIFMIAIPYCSNYLVCGKNFHDVFQCDEKGVLTTLFIKLANGVYVLAISVVLILL